MGFEPSLVGGSLLLAAFGLLLFGIFGWLAILPKLGLKTHWKPRGTEEPRYVSEAEYQQQMLLRTLELTRFSGHLKSEGERRSPPCTSFVGVHVA
jgi:hypothetical protein